MPLSFVFWKQAAEETERIVAFLHYSLPKGCGSLSIVSRGGRLIQEGDGLVRTGGRPVIFIVIWR